MTHRMRLAVPTILVLSVALLVPGWVAADAGLVAPIREALRANDVEAAEEAGEAAVKRAPSSSLAWLWLGRAYAVKATSSGMFTAMRYAGKIREAFEKAVALDPDNLDARGDLMQFKLAAPGIAGGSRADAEAQAREIAARDPARGKAAEALLALTDEDRERGIALFGEALAMAGGDPAEHVDNWRMFLSQEHITHGRFDQAFAIWDETLEQDPERYMALYQWAKVAAESGQQLERALEIQDALAIRDDAPRSLNEAGLQFRRAQVLEKLGRVDEAREGYRQAAAADDPQVSPMAKEGLGRIGD